MSSLDCRAKGQIDDDEQFEVGDVFGRHGATDGISEQLDPARQLEELTANIQKLNALLKEMNHSRKTVFVEKEDDISDDTRPDDKNAFVAAAAKKMKWRDLFKGTDVNRICMGLLIFIFVGVSATQGYFCFTSRNDQAEERAKMRDFVAALYSDCLKRSHGAKRARPFANYAFPFAHKTRFTLGARWKHASKITYDFSAAIYFEKNPLPRLTMLRPSASNRFAIGVSI